MKRVRGNRGELTVEIYSSQPGRAEKLREVRLEKGADSRSVRVDRVWFHDGRTIVKFHGIDSISEAEIWQGADILVGESDRACPAEGEYAHAALIGCRMLREDSAEAIGAVRGIEEYGGPALLRVEAPDGAEILVPFAYSICREIDPAKKVIRAWLPEGLAGL